MIFVWIILSMFTAVAQEEQKNGGKFTSLSTLVFDVNNISANFQSCGGISKLGDKHHYFVPKTDSVSTIFASTLWIGGRDSSRELRLAANRFRNNGSDFWTGPLSTIDATISPETSADWDRFWVIEKREIEEFLASGGTQIPNSILEWPAHGDISVGEDYYLAPFHDVNNDGKYNPYDGDYPLVKGDRAAFFIFNDALEPHTESGGATIGVEIHGMIYAFDAPQDEVLNNTIFVNYKIINRSSKTLYDTYVAIWTDFDIGYSRDDYIGCDVQRSAYFGYNSTMKDDLYGEKAPIQAVVLLGGPTMGADGTDNPKYEIDSVNNDGYCQQFVGQGNNQYAINGTNFGDGIVDNERMGMTHFIYTTNDASVLGDPIHDDEYYNLLRGCWKNGLGIRYSFSNGMPGQIYYCNHAYTGVSNPCNWGMGDINANPEEDYGEGGWTQYNYGAAPSDLRGIGSMGPFTFAAGETVEIDFAYLTVFPEDSTTRFAKLGSNIDSLRQSFHNGKTPYGQDYVMTLGMPNKPKQTTIIEIILFPNPASETVTIQLKNNDQQLGIIELYDVFGKKILTDRTAGNERQITIKNLASGVYFCRIYSDTKQILGTYKIIKK